MTIRTLLSVALACSLTACGGGGGGTASNTAVTVTGVAATGAPLVDATIQIYDKDNVAVLSTPATVSADGTYSAVIPANAVGPFVFVVDSGSEKFLSVLTEKRDSTLNITPLSHLVAAKLSSKGNPFELASEIKAGTTSLTSSKVGDATSTVMAALKPLADGLGIAGGFNPLTSSFSADGTGFDRMLDSLDVKIDPTGDAAQIDITVKQTLGEAADPPKVTYTTKEAVPTLPSGQYANAALPAGSTPKLLELMKQLTSCFAVTLEDRIVSGGSTAADIKSQACKAAFFDDNPAQYRAGGLVVSKTQHFRGIFNTKSDAGVVFSEPKMLYVIADDVTNGPKKGDVVFAYRWKDEFGNFQFERNIAREQNGKLKLIGNQYLYDIGVTPYHQIRTFLNQAESTYTSVGYVFNLSCAQLNQLKTGANKVVKVNITTPRGKKITLIPSLSNGICNFSYFVIANPATKDPMGDNATRTGTGFIRLRSEYHSKTTTEQNHPRNLETFLAFVSEEFSVADIQAINPMATWKFEYYNSTAQGSSPVATQFFKPGTKPMIPEAFRQVKLPQLTASLQESLKKSSQCDGNYCYVTQATGPFEAEWVRPDNSGNPVATWLARVYGRKAKTITTDSFEDSLTFRSNLTKASIRCGQGETTVLSYCSGSSASQANFGANVSIDSIDLVSRVSAGIDASHMYVLRKLAVAN